MRTFLRHLLMRLRRDRLDDELRDEMALHVELRAAELVERGMSPEDARAAALRRFGNTTLLREESRTMWGFGALETFLQDARYALRTMARAKMLTGVVVVSLAIGIGANAAIFSIADDVLFRKLPVASPDDLVLPSWVSSTKKLPGGLWGSLQASEAGGFQSTSFTYSAYEAFRERKDLFTDSMAFKRLYGRANVVIDGDAELATARSCRATTTAAWAWRPRWAGRSRPTTTGPAAPRSSSSATGTGSAVSAAGPTCWARPRRERRAR